ncbi:MAG TPA: Uma2 family endonuclease [Thermoanaerobaculia bacterium]|nr:Uma2 family endonuclease [Thermoanaerobaculia bacterium]
MGMPDKAKLIYEDYLLFPNDGRRHELIGGEHYVSPAPKKRHQRASGNLYRLLSVPIYEQRLGFLYAAPFDVVRGTGWRLPCCRAW